MHPDRHVDSSLSLDEDQTVDIKRRFFFTRDMTNYGCYHYKNEHDLKMTIRISTFNLSHWSKMKRRIQQLHPISLL